ncbi:deoxyhypusine synthase [Candidatus Altiarchaeota archaeon]
MVERFKTRMVNVKDMRKGCPAKQMRQTGFQATKIEEARNIISRMKADGATVFLSFTANMMASGLRGLFIDMVEEGFVDVVVTTGGSIDHDIIRAYKPYILGSFDEDDVGLHKGGVNRIGNILVPNDRYELLEKKVTPLFKRLYHKKKTVTPVELTKYLADNLKKDTFIRECSIRDIPVFNPGIIDGALGLQLFFFRQTHRDFIIDPLGDMQQLLDIVYDSPKTGGIILGGGISKHHTIGANLLRGGLDYAVYVTTAAEFDGSLSGAHPREAKSWGKIREKARAVTVTGDATVMLPVIMATL